MSRGIDRERRLRERLEQTGWWTCRAAGSFGEADIVALKQGELPKMIEVKSTARGPFAGFGPAKRDALISAAARAGAIPWLVWWPPRDGAHWIPVSNWPPSPVAAIDAIKEPSPCAIVPVVPISSSRNPR